MKKYELNAKGLACPLPVVQTKKLLEEYEVVETTVDNFTATENLEKLANQLNYHININKINDEEYKVTISKEEVTNNTNDKECGKKNDSKKESDDSYIVVINNNIMGHGNEELGSKLIKAFLYSLTEQEVLPNKILFYNGGALLVDKNKSHVLSELKELENRNVELMCCGACIDYYKVDLAIGSASNMYFITEEMRKANRIVKP